MRQPFWQWRGSVEPIPTSSTTPSTSDTVRSPQRTPALLAGQSDRSASTTKHRSPAGCAEAEGRSRFPSGNPVTPCFRRTRPGSGPSSTDALRASLRPRAAKVGRTHPRTPERRSAALRGPGRGQMAPCLPGLDAADLRLINAVLSADFPLGQLARDGESTNRMNLGCGQNRHRARLSAQNPVTTSRISVAGVIGPCSRVEVNRVHAKRSVAVVENHQARWNRTVRYLPREAMGTDHSRESFRAKVFLDESEMPVRRLAGPPHSAAGPKPAHVGFIDTRPKAFLEARHNRVVANFRGAVG